MGREENVLIFQDTERLSKTNGKLNADLKTSASGQKLILETDALEKPKVEKAVGGYTGFLFLDDKGLTLVAMHWKRKCGYIPLPI